MADPITYGLTHLAVAVNDIQRTMLFYQTTPGCNDILVFEKKEDGPVGYSGGVAHFGFRLKKAEDIEQMVAKIIDAGGIITDKGEFVKGSPYVFFKDPDGYEVEVWYELL